MALLFYFYYGIVPLFTLLDVCFISASMPANAESTLRDEVELSVNKREVCHAKYSIIETH